MSDDQSGCLSCGARVSVAPGESCPPHQAYGSRDMCAGSGQPTG